MDASTIDGFMTQTGGGAKGLFNQYDAPGTIKEGVITDLRVAQQTKFGTREPLWFDKEQTKPRMELVIDMQTEYRDAEDPEDDGMRSFRAKGSNKEGSQSSFGALRDAVQAKGKTSPEVGGKLQVAFLNMTPIPNSDYQMKNWACHYEPPVPGAEGAQFFAQQAAQAATPVAQATPAPAANPFALQAAPVAPAAAAASPFAQQAAPAAPVAQAPATPAALVAQAPAPAAPVEDQNIVAARQLLGIGNSPEMIAATTGLDLATVQALSL
jgi:hypothetical protein